VLVVDAPLASAYAAAMLGAIQKTVPGKPVRYLVSTHYHYDHSGGARPFMAAGATIVTTRGNREHFERLAAVQSTLRSDKLQIDPGKLDFQFVDKMDRIEGSARTVEVYRLDSLSHVDEMLVVYLPKERLVFQADLYSESVAPNASTHEFAEWLSSTKGLKVDRIAGVHAPVITLSELLAVVAE
jgi:glyoxylase-like metal-dependent hydrolase (beta-lactamase superfamily II)